MRYLVLCAALAAAACGQRTPQRDRQVPIRLPLAVASAATPSAIPTRPPGPYVWTTPASGRALFYGPANAPVLLAIGCEGWAEHAARFVIVRFARADRGAEALLAIQGSKGILRLPVSARKVGKAGYVWRGELDAADPRAEVLLGNGLKATVPGGGMLQLPPLGAAGAVVTQCAAEARAVEPIKS